MRDSWIITIPQQVEWADYEREMATVADGSSVMNYRVAFRPKSIHVGDRCYVVWRGRVRGWMRIVGVEHRAESWTCTTTGTVWRPGHYLQRSGPFHYVDGEEMRGFQGTRKYPDHHD